MRVAGIVNESVVDGPGIRLAVFFQGCGHHCRGCHNEATWPFDEGNEITTEEIMELYDNNPLLDGITLTGGDPVYQADEALKLAVATHERGGNVWLYTGFLFEEIRDLPLIQECDVIVDGPFLLEQRDISLEFRGSSNQRILRKGIDY